MVACVNGTRHRPIGGWGAAAGSGRSSTPHRAVAQGMLVPWRRCRPPSLWAPRAHRLAVTGLAVAVTALGLASFGRYVHDYVLYRGFGPPVATVPPAEQGRIATLAFRSPSLGGRTERALVYLPAAYRMQPAAALPGRVSAARHAGRPAHGVRQLAARRPAPRPADPAPPRAAADRRDATRLALDLRQGHRVGQRTGSRRSLVHVSHARPRPRRRRAPAHDPQRLRPRHRRLFLRCRRGSQRDPAAPPPLLGRRGLERGLPPDARDGRARRRRSCGTSRPSTRRRSGRASWPLTGRTSISTRAGAIA